MRCCNCGSNDWENIDSVRLKPAGMSICKSCSFISYPDKWKTDEEIKKHYRGSYRPPPTHNNYFSGERKNHFHHAFLHDLFSKWKAEGLENPRICEIGAAFGFTLNWIRQIFPKAEIYGTELTTSFRRNAFHEYGITLTEEIDETKKYDLIMSYKVLEHQLDPDLQLEKYKKCLAPNGLFYISVPTWFNSLFNFGLDGFDLEYYYDPNHINVWTHEMFEGMLANAGFEIVKNDQIIYSSTYLCKPVDKVSVPVIVRHDVEEMKSKLEKIKEAYFATTDNRFDRAIELWPDYPQAHISRAEMMRQMIQTKGWPWFKENVVELAIKQCPNSASVLIMATDFAMRCERWTEAIGYCERALLAKPENPVSLHSMANIMREMALRAKDEKEKLHYFDQARQVACHLRNVSTQHFREASDLILLFNSKLPFKGEHAAKPNQSKETSLPVGIEQKGGWNETAAL